MSYQYKISDLYRVKPLCIIASDNVVINGDVAFTRRPLGMLLGDYTHLFMADNINNLTIVNTTHLCAYKHCNSFKLKFLWFWHMVILRKDAVYLTGIIK